MLELRISPRQPCSLVKPLSQTETPPIQSEQRKSPWETNLQPHPALGLPGEPPTFPLLPIYSILEKRLRLGVFDHISPRGFFLLDKGDTPVTHPHHPPCHPGNLRIGLSALIAVRDKHVFNFPGGLPDESRAFCGMSDNDQMFGGYCSRLSFSVVVEEGHRWKESGKERS